MAIEHTEQCDGALHITTHLDKEGRKVRSIGMLEPGNYDLGSAEVKQSILVSTGSIDVNLHTVIGGQECGIDAGEKIKLSATAPSTFLLFYNC